jgi:hypothetical protein
MNSWGWSGTGCTAGLDTDGNVPTHDLGSVQGYLPLWVTWCFEAYSEPRVEPT